MFLKKYNDRWADGITKFVNDNGILKSNIQQIVYDGYSYTLFYWDCRK